jgi:hypothetical protein
MNLKIETFSRLQKIKDRIKDRIEDILARDKIEIIQTNYFRNEIKFVFKLLKTKMCCIFFMKIIILFYLNSELN